MDPLSKELVDLLGYLLPGFITAAILYNLTPSPRPAPFERIVQALIFTVLIQVVVFGVEAASSWTGRNVFALGAWTDRSRLIWSVTLAILFGLMLARLLNHDRLHAVLRKLRITHQTSYSTEWYGALAENRGYLVLHMSGERRLYGWPQEWPNTPDTGHFIIAEAEWLDEEKGTLLTGVDKILVDVSEVTMVEFMTISTDEGAENHGRSKGTNTAAK